MKIEMRALTIIALATALLLTGCGQKGPLYMPADRQGDDAAMVSEQASEKPSKAANGESTPADTATDAPEDES